MSNASSAARIASSSPSSSAASPAVPIARISTVQAVAPRQRTPRPAPKPIAERMATAKARIEHLALGGERMRSYEVALDVDMSEFHFARQFRLAFGRSPHVFYDEVRAAHARRLLAHGQAEGEVARRIGYRRPAELRALLAKPFVGSPSPIPMLTAVGA
jgi:AraC-like DNA-binding protein